MAVIQRNFWAVLRAAVVTACLLAPILLIAPERSGAADVALLAALFAGLVVAAEYGAPEPGLIAFRDAPPFNRIRFAILAAALVLCALAAADERPLGALMRAAGLALAAGLDAPGTPLHAVILAAGDGAGPALRATAALAMTVAALGVAGFAFVLRLTAWPGRAEGLNLWTVLPSFDGAGRDALVARLRRDGAVNLLLAAAAAYATPPLAAALGAAHGLTVRGDDLLLVWSVSLWAFLPAFLALRGLALRRLAAVVALHPADAAERDAFAPA